MMKEELLKQSEELEQTLEKQLQLFKQDSQVYLKVGGLAILGGVLAVYTVNQFGGKGKKKVSKKKKPGKKPYSFFGNLRSRLFWMLVGVGKAKLMEVVMAKVGNEEESN
ncbi:hypothetical protein Q4534_20495 [Cyclobacterium sp. 1_MG-2023]|uniref:hypothetical protein n=1 Tax=Cyclobacterium sp. 1_MG-2023 TaxID=3062681 RepID=UPI0026E24D6C|nr:hypothetical protein [Cyclobacterium sp. 1_MG-2023]MDO6439818.1 hypothetical protein [Cyclobacterium sp. 1_MG-2023]